MPEENIGFGKTWPENLEKEKPSWEVQTWELRKRLDQCNQVIILAESLSINVDNVRQLAALITMEIETIKNEGKGMRHSREGILNSSILANLPEKWREQT